MESRADKNIMHWASLFFYGQCSWVVLEILNYHFHKCFLIGFSVGPYFSCFYECFAGPLHRMNFATI